MSEDVDEFRNEAGDLVRGRGLVLLGILVDAGLLVLTALILVGGHIAIEYFLHGAKLSLIDEVLLTCVQVLTAVSALGVLLAFLARDVLNAFRRVWKN